MTHRSDRVYLPADEPRCGPSKCRRREQCARYLSAIPKSGASIADFSVMNPLICLRYIPASHKWPADKPAKEVKPWPTA